jgi:heme A synthase
MSQNLIFGFPIPVVLALGVLVLVLFGLARLLASMRKPAPVRDPRRAAPCDAEREEAAWRF